jgi:hypothetical protein
LIKVVKQDDLKVKDSEIYRNERLKIFKVANFLRINLPDRTSFVMVKIVIGKSQEIFKEQDEGNLE